MEGVPNIIQPYERLHILGQKHFVRSGNFCENGQGKPGKVREIENQKSVATLLHFPFRIEY